MVMTNLFNFSIFMMAPRFGLGALRRKSVLQGFHAFQSKNVPLRLDLNG